VCEASEKPLLAFIETSIANGVPTVSLAATSVLPADEDTPLAKAIAMVKAAGYRINRAKASKIPKPKKRVGPSFIATFTDGANVRMTVYCSSTKLDWDRGVRLAQAAWRSRWRRRQRIYTPYPIVEPVPPAIIAMHFEQDGVVLGRRSNGGAVS
jgi:hypothetical protein